MDVDVQPEGLLGGWPVFTVWRFLRALSLHESNWDTRITALNQLKVLGLVWEEELMCV